MAQAFRFICNSCGETIESGDEGNPYYLDKRGRKQYAYHRIRNAIAASASTPLLVFVL
jgi:hypothetical protein